MELRRPSRLADPISIRSPDIADHFDRASPSLLEALPSAVYVCDAAGVVVRYNRKAAELWGRAPKPGDPAERYCGSFRLFWPDGRPLAHAECPVADVLRTGQAICDQEVMIERPDGSRIIALVNITALRDETGAITGAVNCFHEITQRKRLEEELRRAEEALRERERWLTDLLNALPAAIYTTDSAGRITFYNEAAVEFSGRRPELGRDEWCVSWRLYRPDGTPLPHDECPMAVSLKEGRPIRDGEAIAERPDGTRVPFIPYPTPLRDASGAVIGAVNMLIDITARTAVESAAAQLAAIVESSEDAIVGKTLDGIVTSWNVGAERIFGYRADEMIGQHISRLFPPERLAEEEHILGRIRRGERVAHYETVRRHKSGREINVSLTVSPIKDAKGRVSGASKIARDITERKQAEARLKLLAREVDHRAKNILTTVMALTRMTQADTVPAFTEALMGRFRALSQAHRLLVKSRWAGAEIKHLIEEELNAFGANGDGHLAISGPNIVLPPDLAQGLAMVIHELATNAAKYGALSMMGGRVAVEWITTDDRLLLRWTEAGGPAVKMPSRKGFGTGLIEATAKSQLKGEVSFDWRPQGLVCEFSMSIGQSPKSSMVAAGPCDGTLNDARR